MSEEIKKEETAAEEAAEQKPEKKKKSKKEDEAEKLKKELAEKDDLLKRTAAEFDNFKKRSERERSGIAEFAKAGVIKQLLPIIDNIERADACESGSEDYVKGIEMIVKQFKTLSQNLGIEEIASEGDAFDPNLHEAVIHIDDDTLGENEIVQVLQKGYRLGDTVIRHAMVKVAN